MVSELEKNLGWYIRKAHVAIQAGLSKLGGVWKAADGPILPFLLDQGIPKDLIVAQFEALECGTYGQHFVKLDALQRHKYRILRATLAGAELKAYNDLAKFLGIEIKPITNQSKTGLFLTRLVSAHTLRVTNAKLRAGCAFVGIPFSTPAEDNIHHSIPCSSVAPVPGATGATSELPLVDEWIEDDVVRFLVFFLQGVYPYLTDTADAAHCKLLYTELFYLEFDITGLYAGDFDFVKRLMKLFDARETFKETHNPDNNVLGWSLCPLDEMSYWTLRAAVDERCSPITSVLNSVCAELGTTLPTFRISSVPCSSVSESPEDALISLEASASPGTGEATEEATGASLVPGEAEKDTKELAEEVPLTTNLVDKLEWWLQRMEASIFSRFVKEHGVVFSPETERNGETLLTAMLSLGHTREDVAAMLTVYQRSAAGEHAVFLNDEEFHVARAIDAIADCLDDEQFGLFHKELFGPSYEGPTVFSAACQFVGANGGRSLGMICDACYATGIAVPAALSIPEREREHEDDSSDVDDDSVDPEVASNDTPVVASGATPVPGVAEATEATEENNTDVSMDTEVSTTTEVRTAISAIAEMLISSEESQGDVASSSTDTAPVVASSSTVVASVPEATEATMTKTIWVQTDLANNLDWWLDHIFSSTILALSEYYNVKIMGYPIPRTNFISAFKRMNIAPKDVAIAIDRIQREEAGDACDGFSSCKMHYARLMCAAFFGLSELNRKNLYASLCDRPWPGHITLPDICRIVQTHGYRAYLHLKEACNKLGIVMNTPPEGASTSKIVREEITYTVPTSEVNALSTSASTPGGAPTPEGASTPVGVDAELYEAVAPDLVKNLEFWINRACGKTWRKLCGSPKIHTIADCLANHGSREATAARLEWLERQDAGLYCEELDANAFHAARFVRLAMQSARNDATQKQLLDTLTAGMGLFLSQTSVMAQACQIVRYHGTAITSVLSSVCKALDIVLPNPSARAEREEAKALAAMARKFGHAVYTKLLDHYGVSSFYDILDKGVKCADIHAKLFEIKNAPVVASSSTEAAPVSGATTGSLKATKESLLAMQAPDLVDHLELWVDQATYETRANLRAAFGITKQRFSGTGIVAAIEKKGVFRAAIAGQLSIIQRKEFGCDINTNVHALRMLCATFLGCTDQDKRRHLAVALGEPDQYVSPSTTTIHAMALNILRRYGEQTVARLYEACAEAGVVFFNVVGNRTPPSKRNCSFGISSVTPVVTPVPGVTGATPEKAAETLTPEELEIPDLIDNLEWWIGEEYSCAHDSLRSHFKLRGMDETVKTLEERGVSRAAIAAQLTVIQRKHFGCNTSHTDEDVHIIRMLHRVFGKLCITDVRRQFAKEMGVPCYDVCVNARTVSLLILNKHKSGTIAQLKKVCGIMGLNFPTPPQKKSTASASNGASTSAEAPLRTFSEEEKTCIEAINDAYVKVVTALMAKEPFVSATKADKVRKELVDNLEWWVNRSSATIRHALCKNLGHPLIYTFFNRHTVADLVGAAIHPALIARALNDLQQKQVPEPLQFTDEELHVVRLVAATMCEHTGDAFNKLLEAMDISHCLVHDRVDAFREACRFAAKHRENTLPLLATLCSIPTPKTEPPCISLTCLRCHPASVSVSAVPAETSTPVETAETSDSDSDSSDSDSDDEEEEIKETPTPVEKERPKETFNALPSPIQEEHITSILKSLGLGGMPFSIVGGDSDIVTVRVGVPETNATTRTRVCNNPNCVYCPGSALDHTVDSMMKGLQRMVAEYTPQKPPKGAATAPASSTAPVASVAPGTAATPKKVEINLPGLVEHVGWWLGQSSYTTMAQVCTFFGIHTNYSAKSIINELTNKGVSTAAIASAMDAFQRLSAGHELVDITAKELHAARLVSSAIYISGPVKTRLMEYIDKDLATAQKDAPRFTFACYVAKKHGKNTINVLDAACAKAITKFPTFPASFIPKDAPASSVPEEAPKEAPKNPEPVAPKMTQEQREELFWEGVQQVFMELSIHTIARIAEILLPIGPHLAVTKLASELKANNVSHYAVYGCFYRFANPAATDKIGILISTHID